MSYKDIINQSEMLSMLPYVYVIATLIELDNMGLLGEIDKNDDNNSPAC